MTTSEKIRELKTQIDLYNHYRAIGKAVDEKIAADIDAGREPHPEEENICDLFYKKEYAAFTRAAEIINELTGGRVDTKTARQMINTLGEDITSLLENSKAVKEAQA